MERREAWRICARVGGKRGRGGGSGRRKVVGEKTWWWLDMSRLSFRPRPLDIYKKLPIVKSVKDLDGDDNTASRNLPQSSSNGADADSELVCFRCRCSPFVSDFFFMLPTRSLTLFVFLMSRGGFLSMWWCCFIWPERKVLLFSLDFWKQGDGRK
jgi:hypothetical protein